MSSHTLVHSAIVICFFNFRYLKPEGSNVLKSLDGPILDTELKNFEEILQRNRKKLFDEHFIDGKRRSEVSHHPLYVTGDQRVVAEDINNATKDEILKRIADKLQEVSDEDVRGPLSIKLELLRAQFNKSKKDGTAWFLHLIKCIFKSLRQDLFCLTRKTIVDVPFQGQFVIVA